ncbi:hypothetical protein [Enterobacter sp. BIGb0359]|uniref:hypothetical protein n=1 Tax=Enterobacter sp. BIGb0359 TaxID=2485133 RepID=UPI0016198D93|nr:hypothetical protein [Enterobacter sp. BIGb0359]
MKRLILQALFLYGETWQNNRAGGQSRYKMATVMVSAREKALSEAINNQGNDDH